MELKTWSLLLSDPQVPNSRRLLLIILIDEPNISQKEKTKYNIFMIN